MASVPALYPFEEASPEMNPALYKSATDVISSQFRGIDCSDLAEATVVGWIEELYLGGWSKFEADHTPELPTPVRDSNPYQLLREVRRVTGVQVKLKMFESIERVTFSEEKVMVLVNICEVTEHHAEYRIKRTGKRLTEITVPAKGWGRIVDEIEIWDADSSQTHKRLDPETPLQTRQREEWELLCYRPGTSKTPLDNYDSVDSDRMAKHWRKS